MVSYVIAGASRGLGYEFLKQLGANPSNTVIGLVRDKASVDRKVAADKLPNVHILKGDMVDHVSLASAAKETEKITGGQLDILVVNGGYVASPESSYHPSQWVGKEELLKSDLTESFLVNVLGPIYTINAFLPLIRAGVAKKIIVISTGMADPAFVELIQSPDALSYASSKVATNMVVTKFGIELKKDGIIVLALSPGLVNTVEKQPTPEEIAQFTEQIELFKSYAPNFTGPISPTESVLAQLKVINNITIKETGKFLSHHGNTTWL